MKSFYLFLVFAFGMLSSATAQSEPLVSFVKYGDCYMGLKTQQGRIVWPAEFESIVQRNDYDGTSYPRIHYWIAEKNGSFGVIDSEGKLMIPFEYSRIALYEDGFIAADENAAYLLSKKGEVNIKFHEISWIVPTSVGYLIQKNEKFGFLGLRQNEVLPADYSKIEFSEVLDRSEMHDQVLSNRFLTVYLNEKKAIYDLLTETWVVSFTTDYIEPVWASACSMSDVVFIIYTRDSHSKKILNSAGKEVYQEVRSYVPIILTPTDSCGTQSIQLAYIESNRKMKILNLKTGDYSNEHIEIHPVNGYSVFFDEKNWGVIDPNLRELKSLPYPKYELETYEGIEKSPRYSTAQNRYSTLFKYLGWNEKIDSVLITRTNIKKSKKYEHSYELFGLINFRTGKKIRTKYHEIVRRDLGNQTVYWAMIYNNPHDSYYERIASELDIFDSDLNLIQQLENLEEILFDHERKGKRNYNVVIKQNGLKGVVDAFGNEVIPIKFNNCGVQRIYKNQHYNDVTIFYSCSVKQNPDDQFKTICGLFSENGKVLIPMEYRQIYFKNDLIFATRTKDDHDIYDLNGDLFFKGAQFYGNAREVTKSGECIGKNYSDELKHTYIVKGDKLYHVFEGKLEQYDSKSFDFPQKYCYFLEWILIDQNAKVITTDPIGISRRSQYYSNYVTDCSTFLNEYPIPIKENPAPKVTPPPSKIEVAPAHQWKLGPMKSRAEWFLYAPDGNLKYETAFEFPAYAGGIFKQNGRIGRFDADFNIDIAPEYEYIHFSGTFAKNYGAWFLRKGKSNEWSDGFDAISTRKWNNLRFVFNDEKIGLIDDSLNFAVPLTDSIAFIEKYDLVKILNLETRTKETKRYKQDEIIFNALPADLYRKINNRHVIEEAFLNSTGNEILEVSPVNTSYSELSSEISGFSLKANETQVFRERIPSYFKQYFYSEITYTRSQKYYGHYLEGRQYADLGIANYKIVANELVPIKLSDILKTDAKSTQKLNEMMLRELTEIQAFGSNCTDIESKIEDLKSNFLIAEGGIEFHYGVRGGFSIYLSSTELRDLLRDPNKLTWW